MNRPVAARIARPFGSPAAPARPRAAGTPRRPAPARRLRIGALAGAAAEAIRGLASATLHRRGLLRALIALVICVPLLAGGYLLLRRSPLVAVEHVRVSGVHGPEARTVERALVSAARGMSTLDVNSAAFTAAVSPYAVVGTVRAYPSFPHGLRIVVSERLPVASVTIDGAPTAVAADGAVLGAGFLSSSLPTIGGEYLSRGRHVSNWGLLAALSVLGAEPAPLARLTAKVYTGPYGLTVALRNGLLIYFGDAPRPHAKWLSLERVLVDPSSAGASSIDVRMPERPAAAFASGSAPAASSTSAGASASTLAADSEATQAALAAGLSEGGGGTVATPVTATGSTESSTGASSAQQASGAPSSGSSEATSETPSEAPTPSG